MNLLRDIWIAIETGHTSDAALSEHLRKTGRPRLSLKRMMTALGKLRSTGQIVTSMAGIHSVVKKAKRPACLRCSKGVAKNKYNGMFCSIQCALREAYDRCSNELSCPGCGHWINKADLNFRDEGETCPGCQTVVVPPKKL